MAEEGGGDWLEEILEGLGDIPPGWRPSTHELKLALEAFDSPPRRSGSDWPSISIDLGPVPPQETLSIHVDDGTDLELRDLHPDAKVNLHIRKRSACRWSTTKIDPPVLDVSQNMGGPVSISNQGGVYQLLTGFTGTAILREGDLARPKSGLPDKFHLIMEGGCIESGRVDNLKLSGGTHGAPIKIGSTEIGECQVAKDSIVRLEDGGRRNLIHKLHGSSTDTTLTIWSPVQRRDEKSPTTPLTFPVGELKHLRIDSDEGIDLQVSRSAEHITFDKKCRVTFQPHSDGSHLTFKGQGSDTARQCPHVQASARSVLTYLSGEVSLGDVRGAHIEGDRKDPIKVWDIQARDQTEAQGKDPDSIDLCDGLFLTNFDMEDGLTGRSMLARLENAHHLSPNAENLPGRLTLINDAKSLYQRIRPAPDEESAPKSEAAQPKKKPEKHPQHDAEFMRKLRELTREKGASGKVRTRVGWNAQRLRHKTSTSLFEKSALWGYRALGYGERPGPAIATWLVLSFIFALALWSFGNCPPVEQRGTEAGGGSPSPEPVGCLSLPGVWLDHAVAPIGAITGTGAAAEQEAWLYLIRAVLAIPLIVGAMSLRNYVRPGK